MSAVPPPLTEARAAVIGGLLIALGPISLSLYTPAMPELERYVLNELRSCSACNAISTVTVSEAARPDSNWEVSHINAAGGPVGTVQYAHQNVDDALRSPLGDGFEVHVDSSGLASRLYDRIIVHRLDGVIIYNSRVNPFAF